MPNNKRGPWSSYNRKAFGWMQYWQQGYEKTQVRKRAKKLCEKYIDEGIDLRSTIFDRLGHYIPGNRRWVGHIIENGFAVVNEEDYLHALDLIIRLRNMYDHILVDRWYTGQDLIKKGRELTKLYLAISKPFRTAEYALRCAVDYYANDKYQKAMQEAREKAIILTNEGHPKAAKALLRTAERGLYVPQHPEVSVKVTYRFEVLNKEALPEHLKAPDYAAIENLLKAAPEAAERLSKGTLKVRRKLILIRNRRDSKSVRKKRAAQDRARQKAWLKRKAKWDKLCEKTRTISKETKDD